MKDEWRNIVAAEGNTLRREMLKEFDEIAAETRFARAILETADMRKMYLLVGGHKQGDQMRKGHLAAHVFLRAAAPDRYRGVAQPFERFYLANEDNLDQWLSRVRGLIEHKDNLRLLPSGHLLNDDRYQAAWMFILSALEPERCPGTLRRQPDQQEMNRRAQWGMTALGYQ